MLWFWQIQVAMGAHRQGNLTQRELGQFCKMEKITAEMSRVGIDQVESGWSEGEVKTISRESKKHFPSPGVKNSKTPGGDSGSLVWLQKLGEGAQS